MKYIFVTGGVVSGLGKGICAASLGRLLKQCGLKVKNQKFDPYLNVDPGTMSPYQHGEVFVTDDGAETDLDLGHYERFVDEALDEKSSVSSGKIFWSVLNRERQGGYLGGTVQIIPHVTDEIKRRIYDMDDGKTDVAISEIGGTVGDIESQPFLEAIRQVAAERGRENVLFIHVPLIVTIPGSGELKSKPTQHSVKELLSEGIQPDVLVVRTDEPITDDIRRKIALFCNVEPDCVIQNATASTLYEVPLLLEHEGLCRVVCRKLHLDCGEPDMTEWRALVDKIHGVHRHVRIALVGKYVGLHDAYLSVVESLFHAGTACDASVEIQWVDSETLTSDNIAQKLCGCSGILVPGGFGDRGIEGMILAAQYARERGIPYLGICLGMQIAVIEFARHVLSWDDATSAEFSSTTAHPVIALMPEQVGVTAKGGTMRLGKYPCVLEEGSLSRALYDAPEIWERHRHRYEFNNDFRDDFTDAGMRLAGLSPDGTLVEIVESKSHPGSSARSSTPNSRAAPTSRIPCSAALSQPPSIARSIDRATFLFLQYRWKNGKSYDMMLLPYYWIRQENFNMNHQTIIVLDFGGQYNQLIARRVRECGVYCEVKPYTTPLADLLAMNPIGFIFTGGPNSVYLEDAPHVDPALFDAGVPVLGICYGCQLIAHHLGGKVVAANDATAREYGKTETFFDTNCKLFKGLPEKSVTWMSHGDYMEKVPEGFSLVAHSDACPNVAICDETRGFYGVQYHPEVNHTEFGTAMIRNFLYEVCGATGDWTMGDYKNTAIAAVREKVGSGRVLLALSGGVDSSVVAALLAEAVGPQLTCVFVDHGLMRLNEGDEVEAAFKKWDINFVRVNAEGRFLSKLAGISDPERKRKIIGEEFIRVFEEESKKIGAVDFLAQGTIYPDVIESGLGNAAVIKSHHNVGGLPDYVDFKEIIEPLRLLFKDEVRQLGRELGLPEYLVSRQPFPGPGLAIRIMGEITKEKADTLRLADAIYREELEKAGENKKMNQYFAVLTDTRTVGVMGDGRSYDRVLALRAVTTEDFMTADWARIPYELLDKISGRIVNEVKGINRIVYDITSKPPATVEWE